MNPGSAHDQAAAWAARLDAGPLARDEAEALTRWLDAEPGHEVLLEEMQQLHRRVGMVLPEMAATGRLAPASEKARGFLPRLAWTGALAAVLALALVWFTRRPEHYDTVAAQRQTLALADGTTLEMNARTRVEVRLGGKERALVLREGEVFLQVAKDPARPFLVETPAGRVRVTGTRFSVAHQRENQFSVLLVEGAVEATATGGNVRALVPGDRFAVDHGNEELRRLTPAQIADALAWREGRVVFHSTPLPEALARFAAHHGRTIAVAPAARGLVLGGRFNLDDFAGFLRDLPVVLPVSVHDDGAAGVRIERRGDDEK